MGQQIWRTDVVHTEQGGVSTPKTLRNKFFEGAFGLKEGWVRELCGGLMLTQLPESELGPNSIVWNVRTSEGVIPNHSDIDKRPLNDFIDQIAVDAVRPQKPIDRYLTSARYLQALVWV